MHSRGVRLEELLGPSAVPSVDVEGEALVAVSKGEVVGKYFATSWMLAGDDSLPDVNNSVGSKSKIGASGGSRRS
jgi:hypothetical protein